MISTQCFAGESSNASEQPQPAPPLAQDPVNSSSHQPESELQGAALQCKLLLNCEYDIHGISGEIWASRHARVLNARASVLFQGHRAYSKRTLPKQQRILPERMILRQLRGSMLTVPLQRQKDSSVTK